MLAKRPHTTADEVENLLAARLARQEILTRDDPPLVYVVWTRRCCTARSPRRT